MLRTTPLNPRASGGKLNVSSVVGPLNVPPLFPQQAAGLLSSRGEKLCPPLFIPPQAGGRRIDLPRLRGTEGVELHSPAACGGTEGGKLFVVHTTTLLDSKTWHVALSGL
ncbi:hypothetical protein U27_06358 [Candidatus Vecturithrix granuli]|uniref:Uncharacterized protein n=1 Tax=Vecturithrix granuli TaxID=1499967 RepID=A0A081C469_VECG1|nr:hypothetical protein U27_06358 [Candidatus Vecturithrix granuli]